MRILQTPVRVFTTGGVEYYVLSLSKALADLGHDIKILASDENGSLPVPRNLRVTPLPYLGKIANTNITPSLPIHLWKEETDIIHTHLPTPWSSDWSSFVAGMKKIPLVLNYYNDISGKGIYSHIAKAYNRLFLKRILDRAGVIIVNRPHFLSPYLADYREKIRVIPPGVDINRFRPGSSIFEWDLFFLSVLDRYHNYKGLETLLSALAIVKKSNPKVKLLIGGTGELLEHYRIRAHEMGIGENVNFAGYIHQNSLPDYYSRSRLFVLPSSNPSLEGFGMVTLEAMACGRAVITTPVSGVAHEIEKAGAGIILDHSNPGMLAEVIRDILADEQKMDTMGRSGRELVEKSYSWERIGKVVDSVYRDMLIG